MQVNSCFAQPMSVLSTDATFANACLACKRIEQATLIIACIMWAVVEKNYWQLLRAPHHLSHLNVGFYKVNEQLSVTAVGSYTVSILQENCYCDDCTV